MRGFTWAVVLGLWCCGFAVTACGDDDSPEPGVGQGGVPASATGGRSQGGTSNERGGRSSTNQGGRSSAESGASSTDQGGDDGLNPSGAGAAGAPVFSAGGSGNVPGGGGGDSAGFGGAELDPLPYAGLGPCHFLPAIGAPTENPNCPNAVFEGNITIESASDIERLAGCQRITGDVTVLSPTLTSLEGLEALRLIDGGFAVRNGQTEGSPRSNPKLERLSGLDGLSCVGGLLVIDDRDGIWGDLSSLANLVEVGGNASIYSEGTLSGLRRVFGEIRGRSSLRSASLPLLEVAIGGTEDFWAPRLHFAGDDSDCFYEGVLGCDWIVETQAALDDLADVSFVTNQLRVHGSVNSLAPLHKLVKAGSLSIYTAAIESLEPLGALRQAATLSLENLNVTTLDALNQLGPLGALRIETLPKLRTLAGLNGLQVRDLYIHDTPALESLGDLSLAEDCERVAIGDAPKLQGIEALGAVRKVGRLSLWNLGVENLQVVKDIRIDTLAVSDNARLDYLGIADADIRSFELASNQLLAAPGGLETVRFSELHIHDNGAMTSLKGLPPFDDFTLQLRKNDSLTNLEGVKGKRARLSVSDNASLSSFSGLEIESASEVSISGNPALHDLSAMTGLDVGQLTVSNSPKIVTLPPLVATLLSLTDNAELTSVNGVELAPDGIVELRRNAKLSSLAGLELENVLRFVIVDNAALADFSVLDGVSVDTLGIVNSPELVTLPAVVVGPGDLTISDNAELTSISALQSAAAGVSRASVSGNPKLSSLTGLPRAKELSLDSNASLIDLSGLESQTLLDELVIVSHPRLRSLRALSGVTAVESVGIYENDALPDCEIVWFGARIGRELPLEMNGPTGPCP